jgi:hypothetical protein
MGRADALHRNPGVPECRERVGLCQPDERHRSVADAFRLNGCDNRFRAGGPFPCPSPLIPIGPGRHVSGGLSDAMAACRREHPVTLVLAQVRAGGEQGIGWTYGSPACAAVISGVLAGVVHGRLRDLGARRRPVGP